MNPGKYTIRADFLQCQGKRLFYLLLGPADSKPRGSVLYLPPFTEEMHSARRIVASQARALAEEGHNVMLLDLSGCGDSSGRFASASWQNWVEDATFAASNLMEMSSGPLTLWGLRLGALLACDVSQCLDNLEKLVFWQPTLNGEQQVDQFLRLRTVAQALDEHEGFDRGALWNELRAGHSLDVAGYELPAALALEMAKVRLSDLVPSAPVYWFELGRQETLSPSVGSQKVIGNWRQQGLQVNVKCVQGEPFWHIMGADINRQLQRATLDVVAL
jgi:exosortase A-associated hydrolase 2